MDPATAALVMQGTSAVMGGMSARAEAKGQQQQARINAYEARTRAMQQDTSERQGLGGELAAYRSVMASNGQAPGTGTLDVMRELREARGRERRINVGNRMSEMFDFERRGENAASKGRWGLLTGFAKAGPSMFDLYQMHGPKNG